LGTGFGPEQTALRWQQQPVANNKPTSNILILIRMCVPSRVDMGVDMGVDMENTPYPRPLIRSGFLSQAGNSIVLLGQCLDGPS